MSFPEYAVLRYLATPQPNLHAGFGRPFPAVRRAAVPQIVPGPGATWIVRTPQRIRDDGTAASWRDNGPFTTRLEAAEFADDWRPQ